MPSCSKSSISVSRDTMTGMTLHAFPCKHHASFSWISDCRKKKSTAKSHLCILCSVHGCRHATCLSAQGCWPTIAPVHAGNGVIRECARIKSVISEMPPQTWHSMLVTSIRLTCWSDRVPSSTPVCFCFAGSWAVRVIFRCDLLLATWLSSECHVFTSSSSNSAPSQTAALPLHEKVIQSDINKKHVTRLLVSMTLYLTSITRTKYSHYCWYYVHTSHTAVIIKVNRLTFLISAAFFPWVFSFVASIDVIMEINNQCLS